MSRYRSNPDYFGGSKPTNASFVGAWILIQDVDTIGFNVVVPGASNPAGTFTLDVTNDPDANKKTDAQITTDGQAPIDYPLTAGQKTAANPAGAGVAIATTIQFTMAGSAQIAPCPACKWCRLKYNFTSGGAASGMTASMSMRGI
jgi:hypothetical protein